jgi:hypothetical protein
MRVKAGAKGLVRLLHETREEQELLELMHSVVQATRASLP